MATVAWGSREELASAFPRRREADPKIASCLGISFWKRRRIADFLRDSAGTSPAFCRSAWRAVDIARRRGGAIAVWASREPPALAALAGAAGVDIIRIEDGFLRSVGLGANFIPGVSIVLDRHGLYLDPARPSDLERLLAETRFEQALLHRADRLIRELVARGISKYNIGSAAPLPAAPRGRRRIFVPGQVEDDRSVTLGGAGIAGNRDLLARVRAANPDAFVIYKPHPDVEAGHRRGAMPDAEALRYADHIVRDVTAATIIAGIDEVHTLTSQCGFEALLRGRRVVVYGQPYYAGWGLTTDLAPIKRRRRKLSLSELVAGALILYPRYVDPLTRQPCEVEVIVERLARPDIWRPGLLVRLRRLQGALARPFRARLGILHGTASR